MPNWADFSPTVAELVQNGFIERKMEEGLDTNMAYRRHALQEKFAGRIGYQMTIPKNGRKAPVTTPTNAAASTANLDNGLTPSLGPTETYTVTLNQYADTSDVDILGETQMAVNLVMKASRDNGVQAAQSIERLARIGAHSCYDTGNTFVRSDFGSGNTTSRVYVNDIRGFQFVQSGGVLQTVSGSYPLLCYEVRTTSAGVNQSFDVIGAVASTPNVSVYPGSSLDNMGNVLSDGIAGYLIISPAATAAPVSGDALIAANAPKIVRPFNKPSENTLTSADVATLGVCLDAKTRLELNNVPMFDDGTYHLLHDAAFMRQLFNDPSFLTAYASRYKSNEWQSGQIFELLGITFISTTETYFQPAQPQLGMKNPIRRSIMIGADSLLQANFDGLDMYHQREGMPDFGWTMLINNVAHILRPPMDRELRVFSMTWTWVGSFTCPTDQTATPIIIPTANNALYKRMVVIQTVG